MKLLFTKGFIREYRALPSHLQKATDKQLELLLANPRHPSLGIKKMNDPRRIGEGRISKNYRLTFQVEGDTYILRRLGPHEAPRRP